MGKIVSSSGNNAKSDKSIFYKKKEKFFGKKITKKMPINKRSVEKAAKVFDNGQKSRKLDQPRSSSSNKGYKQLEDDDVDMEKNADMDERENSSDVESDESSAENMSDVSYADDNDDETDVDNADDDEDLTDVEDPEIEDHGKMFNGKKKGQRQVRSTGSPPFSKRKNTRSPKRLRPK